MGLALSLSLLAAWFWIIAFLVQTYRIMDRLDRIADALTASLAALKQEREE